MGLFSKEEYAEVYDALSEFLKSKSEAVSDEVIRKMNVAEFMQWLGERIKQYVQSLLNSGFDSEMPSAVPYQIALGKMWFLAFDIMKYYSVNYQPNFNNYHQYSVISLNYDALFEIALLQAGRSIGYTPPVAVNHVPFAKIHGSITWLNPAGRGIVIRGRPDNQLFSTVAQTIFSNRIDMEPPAFLNPLELRNIRARDLIRSASDFFVPILIPPLGRFKDHEQVGMYKPIWQLAESNLEHVSELTIIGSTLREEDERLCNLLQTRVKSGTRIIAVGAVTTIKSRLEKILKWDCKQIEPFDTFTDFVKTL